MTPPDDLRRQVLAAVERVRAQGPSWPLEHESTSDALRHYCKAHRRTGHAQALDAILAEFALNPDGTMKEPPA